jgi:hypothetical protein
MIEDRTTSSSGRIPVPAGTGRFGGWHPYGGDRMQMMAFKDLFSFLFQRSTDEDRVAEYVIREHDRGRSLHDILEDKYVVNRLESPEQRARLLDRPEILHAVGGDMVEAAKASLNG